LCGNVNGHANEACGTQCYDPTEYTCASSGLLCPYEYQACGEACYSPSAYSCCNGQLASVGASCSSSGGLPVPWPTENLVLTTEFSYYGCANGVAYVAGFVPGQCYEYGSTSMRTFTCNGNQVNFEACDQSCGQCTVEASYTTGSCLNSDEQYSCGTLALPTSGQTWEMQFSDGNCNDLYQVIVYNNNVCDAEGMRSTTVTCNSTTVIENTYSDVICVQGGGGEGSTVFAPTYLPTGVCISQGSQYSVFYGCGPISQ